MAGTNNPHIFMTKLLYLEDLKRMICDDPNCKHTPEDHILYLHSRCHTHAATWAVFMSEHLRIECAECHEIVSEIAVAVKPNKWPHRAYPS